jgi:hypothetical protein
MSDHIGFGGKIWIKKVEKWLKDEGNSLLLIGSLGLPQTPQLTSAPTNYSFALIPTIYTAPCKEDAS